VCWICIYQTTRILVNRNHDTSHDKKTASVLPKSSATSFSSRFSSGSIPIAFRMTYSYRVSDHMPQHRWTSYLDLTFHRRTCLFHRSEKLCADRIIKRRKSLHSYTELATACHCTDAYIRLLLAHPEGTHGPNQRRHPFVRTRLFLATRPWRLRL
jgi:hypothetical protein